MKTALHWQGGINMRLTILLAIVVLAAAFIAGCGGAKSHWVSSPYRGSIDGVETAPPDGDSNVGVDTWIEVYWPHSFDPPPSRFRFRLEKETDINQFKAVRTYISDEDSYPEGGSWWFIPEDELDYNTVYRITVTDNYGNYYRAYFVTEGRSRADGAESPKVFKPEGAENRKPAGTPSDEHEIDTTKK